MTAEELAALEALCEQRLASLQKQGVTFGGMAEHYTHCLLQAMMTPRQIQRAREAHFGWLADRLDEAEAEIAKQIRQMALTQGVRLNGRRP